MNPLSSALQNLVSGIASEVGTSVTSAPGVQNAITAAQAELDNYKTYAYVASAVALAVVVFYFLPRFESPVPRIFRRRNA